MTDHLDTWILMLSDLSIGFSISTNKDWRSILEIMGRKRIVILYCIKELGRIRACNSVNKTRIELFEFLFPLF